MIIALSLFLELAEANASFVAPETLVAFAQYESHRNPNTIHDNTTGLSYYPQTASAAVAVAESLLAQGHNLDLGIMQVNDANLAGTGLTVGTAFDPGRSIRAGAIILTAAYQRCLHGNPSPNPIEQQAALRCAASVYNTGRELAGTLKGYQAAVWRAAAQIVPAIRFAGDNHPIQPPSIPADDVVAPRPHLPPPALEDALHLAQPVPNDGDGLSDALHPSTRKESP